MLKIVEIPKNEKCSLRRMNIIYIYILKREVSDIGSEKM